MTDDRSNRLRFPEAGLPRDAIRAALAGMQADDVPPHGSRNFRPNYYVDDETLALIDEVSAAVAEQNVLYAGSSYPSLKRIEAELVEMGLDLFHAPVDADGSVTIGGSESNFLAVKTARDLFAATRPTPGMPELVLAHTAHPSFEKAAHLLGVRTRRASASVDRPSGTLIQARRRGPRASDQAACRPRASAGSKASTRTERSPSSEASPRVQPLPNCNCTGICQAKGGGGGCRPFDTEPSASSVPCSGRTAWGFIGPEAQM